MLVPGSLLRIRMRLGCRFQCLLGEVPFNLGALLGQPTTSDVPNLVGAGTSAAHAFVGNLRKSGTPTCQFRVVRVSMERLALHSASSAPVYASRVLLGTTFACIRRTKCASTCPDTCFVTELSSCLVKLMWNVSRADKVLLLTLRLPHVTPHAPAV